MTTQITKYVCDLCHQEYLKEDEAKGCEHKHYKMIETELVYKSTRSKYAERVVVTYDDGKTFTYTDGSEDY